MVKCLFGIFSGHVPFDKQSHDFRFGIGAQGDGFLEVSGVSSGSIIGYFHCSCLFPGAIGSCEYSGTVHPQEATA